MKKGLMLPGLQIRNVVDVATVADDSYGVWQAWYTLIILVVQLLAAGIDIAIVTLLVHPIETTLRINDVGFAAITAAPIAIGLSVAYYPGGLLADIFRRRSVIAVGSVIWAFAALIAARADSEVLFFLARLLAGIGTGITGSAIFSMLTDAFPRTRRALAVGACWSGAAFGTGIGLTICSALVEATHHNGIVHISGVSFLPWQQCFIAVAVIGVLILALVLTLTEPPRRDRSMITNVTLTVSLRTFGQYIKRHALLWVLLLLGGSIACTSYYAASAWGPAFGTRHYGVMGVSSIALLGAFVSAGSLFGSVIGGLLGQWAVSYGNSRILPRMLVTIAIISCVFAAGFPYMPSWLLAAVGIGVVNAAASAQSVLMASAIQETTSNEVRGQLFGVWGFMAYIPSVAAATLVAFLSSSVFAKAGGLGPALAIVGSTMSGLAVLLFAFSGIPYERATHELQIFTASSQSRGKV